MGVNSLPKTVTEQRRGCDLNPCPSAPESSTLTTWLPSHPICRPIRHIFMTDIEIWSNGVKCVINRNRFYCHFRHAGISIQGSRIPGSRLLLKSSNPRTWISGLKNRPKITKLWLVFFTRFITARCYASAVLAMALCLSVCLSVRPSVRHKSVFY